MIAIDESVLIAVSRNRDRRKKVTLRGRACDGSLRRRVVQLHGQKGGQGGASKDGEDQGLTLYNRGVEDEGVENRHSRSGFEVGGRGFLLTHGAPAFALIATTRVGGP